MTPNIPKTDQKRVVIVGAALEIRNRTLQSDKTEFGG
jgi:hypothetical protein